MQWKKAGLTMKKKDFLKISYGVIFLLVIGLIFSIKPVTRLYKVIHLFDGNRISYNFRNMDKIFDIETIPKKAPVYKYKKQLKDLPESFYYKGQKQKTEKFLQDTDTTGLIIIKDDIILYETYSLGADENSKMISWSLAKSLISCLFGIAMEEGYIQDMDKPVDYYVPELKGTGYEGIPVVNVMQMSSGIKFDETYSNPKSDINRMGRVLALNTPIDAFVKSLEKEMPPGQKLHYVSMDTQVLYMVIRESLKKAGIRFSDYFGEKIWGKLGAESDCYWVVDNKKVELAFGGLNATLRDYAKFGSLYLHKGLFNGNRIVPEKWVKSSTKALKPFLEPGTEISKSNLGYGYQWWLPFNNDGDFIALGIYSQYIYVYPKYNMVIAKTSAYANYNTDGAEKICETIEFFREIARKL